MTATPTSAEVKAFLRAVRLGDVRAVSKGIERGMHPDTPEFGQTALMIAAGCGHMNIVTRLMNAGADIHAFDGGLATAFHTAVYHKKLKVADLLLDAGADINAQGRAGVSSTPLHGAIYQDMKDGITDRTAFLLHRGADASIQAYVGIGTMSARGDALAQAQAMPDNKGAVLASLIAHWQEIPSRLRQVTARAHRNHRRFKI